VTLTSFVDLGLDLERIVGSSDLNCLMSFSNVGLTALQMYQYLGDHKSDHQPELTCTREIELYLNISWRPAGSIKIRASSLIPLCFPSDAD